jgi:hypothetical protein
VKINQKSEWKRFPIRKGGKIADLIGKESLCYVISLDDDDFILSAQKIFVTYLLNTKKENFKNVMFLE